MCLSHVFTWVVKGSVYENQLQKKTSDITQLPSERLSAKSLCTLPLWCLFSDKRALLQVWPPLLLALAYEVSSCTRERKTMFKNSWHQDNGKKWVSDVMKLRSDALFTLSFWLGSCTASLRDFGLLDSSWGGRLETVAVSFVSALDKALSFNME